MFSLDDRVAVVTGGTGVLGAAMARGLSDAGARVALLGRRQKAVDEMAAAIGQTGRDAAGFSADVLNRDQLEEAKRGILQRWGRIDIVVNAAGGNVAAATVPKGGSFFDVSDDALREVISVNLVGTMVSCQVFGAHLAQQGEGCIVNVSSMAAQRALSRVGGYGAAKAGVEQFTRWLAVDLARLHGDRLRVNAIAPGFFLGEQNRDLLLHADGSLTERGREIIAHTPAGRFGDAADVVGTLIWLCSPGARFVNGVVVHVDGGFAASGGV
ncbi:MAG: SDR family oxidoreductase [Chloroflexota bacterium]